MLRRFSAECATSLGSALSYAAASVSGATTVAAKAAVNFNAPAVYFLLSLQLR